MTVATAGGSALQGYSSARARRRRARMTGVVAAVLSAAAGSALLLEGGPGWSRAAGSVLVAASVVIARTAWLVEVDPERWLRGAQGERETARLLDGLAGRSWVVRHDLRVPGSRANIDHVAVGRTGVWVVDSKSTRAPVRARWRSVRFGQRRLSGEATRWEAEVVGDRLGAVVRPIIAVHGIGLRRRGGRADGVPVVPATRLVRWMRRGRRRLSRAEIAELSELLDRTFGSRPFQPGAGKKGAASA